MLINLFPPQAPDKTYLFLPTSGTFLTDYTNKSHLHIAITDSRGDVVEFDQGGVHKYSFKYKYKYSKMYKYKYSIKMYKYKYKNKNNYILRMYILFQIESFVPFLA